MSREGIATLVRDALAGVAPESAHQPIDPEADLRDQIDLDSMDFLNFVIALHEATGIDIPEKEMLGYDDAALAKALANGALQKVAWDEQNLSQ